MQNNHISPQLLRSGGMVKVQIQGLLGLYWHFGIVSDRRDWRGFPYVISNSSTNGGVREESWETFSGGQDVRVLGFLSSLQPHDVIANARRLSSKPYNLIFWDCERFARACQGLPPRSSQFEMTLLAAFVGALFLAAQS
ncbi:MAG: hypothetical protein WDM91_19455 [Rhizomicrobium sp.]